MPASIERSPDRRRAQRAWCLYDWANSVFATSVVAAVRPVRFAKAAGRSRPAHQATATRGYASTAAPAVTALLAPVVGALADQTRRRKPVPFAGVLVGAAGTLALSFLGSAAWWALLLAFGFSFIAFATDNVICDSLLPAVASPAELDAASARGFAWGFWGGDLLLAVHLALLLAPRRFGLPDAAAVTRVVFASVTAWWLAFSLPRLRDVPEPEAGRHGVPTRQLLGATLRRLWHTVSHQREHHDLLTFLVAFWLYSDGIGTIIKMATLYGAEVGIGDRDLIGALLMVQLVAAPASLAFGRLARPLGPKRTVLIGIGGYVGISLFACLLARPWQFWVLAGLVRSSRAARKRSRARCSPRWCGAAGPARCPASARLARNSPASRAPCCSRG